MEQFQKQIKPQGKLIEFGFSEIWEYRDLVIMYIKRDILTFYKQTILGPLWFVIQPILTTVMFMFVFGNLAGLSTDGLPQPVFYLGGIIIWSYFSDCLTRNSKVFIENQQVFGKVYFPRMVVPLSITISNLIRFFIQFVIFLMVYFYYFFDKSSVILPNQYIVLVPVLLIMTAGLSLGFGIIFSSLTTKYRDLNFLLQFAVQLWMYITPVIYPLNSIPSDSRWIIALNPMTSIVESFRFAFLGQGYFSWIYLLYSFCFMIVLLLVGLIIFNKVEKGFMDTV
ncbi:MAG: ABC transporter permease [Bacteroidetes bacterium GWF2_38_335]|nr:MAG: ABC transporter permease [Bacteroidetes bacterium GWF2_38_335]OFY76948.1 MAG: ABC transporter permease [Bacteroidetes bacterium RIFOXYA12_FULL_38_20]